MNAPAPLKDKTARRIAELESVLDLKPGHGIMESLADGFIWSTLREPTMMMDGWDFEDPETAEANIRRVVDRWNTEDAVERRKSRKGKEAA